MARLKDIIIERIGREGPISFESFMEMALYYPRLGYYAKDIASIGAEGDFYTGPHVHALFGGMLGKQMEEMWLLLDRPHRFQIVEMGAGLGYLAKDMLDYLETRPLYGHLDYVIVEPNPSYRSGQGTLLGEHAAKIAWQSNLEQIEPFTGCFLSNELLDAFPVKLVEIKDELMEIYVDTDERGLTEVDHPAPAAIPQYLRDYHLSLEPDYRTEINLRIRDWLEQVAISLNSGFVLTIDYGFPAAQYYSPERNRGTLLCYHRHQINEKPFENIGEQDITAHVNFSSLRKWGEDLGLEALGYSAQGPYLVSLGVDELLPAYVGDPPDPLELAKAKQLFLPQGMGESHKVLVQFKGKGKPQLRGFALRNELNKLYP